MERLRLLHRTADGERLRRAALGIGRLHLSGGEVVGHVVGSLDELLVSSPRLFTLSCSIVILSRKPLRLGPRPVDAFTLYTLLLPGRRLQTMFTTYAGSHTLTVTADPSCRAGLAPPASAFVREAQVPARAPGSGFRVPGSGFRQ